MTDDIDFEGAADIADASDDADLDEDDAEDITIS